MPASSERILLSLKARGPQSTQVLATQLGISLPGMRKHLTALARDGLVESGFVSAGVGRPKRVWSLTGAAGARFPDTHAFLTVELLGAARAAFGEAGIERLISHREADARRRYQAALADCARLEDKLARLARLRSDEGYMAETSRDADGAHLLVENHCPICAAARACQGFCRSELALFAAVLGPDVRIERTDHILAGARRCAYRVTTAPEGTR